MDTIESLAREMATRQGARLKGYADSQPCVGFDVQHEDEV